jgi:hypothetical protein
MKFVYDAAMRAQVPCTSGSRVKMGVVILTAQRRNAITSMTDQPNVYASFTRRLVRSCRRPNDAHVQARPSRTVYVHVLRRAHGDGFVMRNTSTTGSGPSALS